jgi:hypothetical protein
MTIIHVQNYTIPIAFMVFAGYMLDRMCKPVKQDEKSAAKTE